MPNKILYFNGCSWAEGAELDSLHNVKNKYYQESEHRVSKLLADKIGYEEVNHGRSGKSHDTLIEEVLFYAHENKENADNIIINVMLTSMERILMYCNNKAMVFNWWMIMGNGAPHQADDKPFEDWRFDERHATFDLARLWSAYFHNFRFYAKRWLKDIILLHKTLTEFGYRFTLSNAFYSFDCKPDEPNLPFYEESTVSGHDTKYNGGMDAFSMSITGFDLYRKFVDGWSDKNIVPAPITYSIKDYLLDRWENDREKYLNVYDRKKLSSVLEGDGTNGYEAKTPNYFFCENGHPSELGHEKIRDLYFTHYTDHEFI